MVVGVLRLSLFFHQAQSLKAKRGPLKRILHQVQSRFAVAAAETGAQDKWQAAEIGVAAVGSSAPVVDAELQKIVDFIHHLGLAEVLDHQAELIHF